jgi:hypothetical protein
MRQLPQSSLPRDGIVYLFANHFLKKNYPNYHYVTLSTIAMFSPARTITYLKL